MSSIICFFKKDQLETKTIASVLVKLIERNEPEIFYKGDILSECRYFESTM